MPLQANMNWGGVGYSTGEAYLLIIQRPRFKSQHSPKNFRGKIIDVADVNQRRWLEESGQWLENVDQIHLPSTGKWQASITKKEDLN